MPLLSVSQITAFSLTGVLLAGRRGSENPKKKRSVGAGKKLMDLFLPITGQ
jgi:hypothetical protein